MSMQASSSPSPVPVKPWSSGRVLTTAQREAKRRKDRNTKRARAEKQKRSSDGLRSQISALQDFIRNRLESYPLLESPYLQRKPPLSPPDPLSRFHDDAPAVEVLSSPQPPKSPSVEPSLGADSRAAGGQLVSRTTMTKRSHMRVPIPPSLSDNRCYSVLKFTNDAITNALEFDMLGVCLNDQLNQDAVIRIVLEGWHVVQGRAYCCPLWKLLEQIDERIFIRSGVLTRFAMLRMIHLMHQAILHVDYFTNLPVWYRPRPTQLRFPHHATADYFAWPGLRERLVVSDCHILTDRFFEYFASCFRLSWPYAIGDTYRIDPTTNLYSFSETFERHIRDISTWTMNREFFENFPDLNDDIAPEMPAASISAAPGYNTSAGIAAHSASFPGDEMSIQCSGDIPEPDP